jgi:hypothetical protein
MGGEREEGKRKGRGEGVGRKEDGKERIGRGG